MASCGWRATASPCCRRRSAARSSTSPRSWAIAACASSTAYSATKGAVLALTRGLAVEYAPFGIRVNALAPGFVETALTARALKNPGIQKALLDSTPLRRFGLPEEIAKAALFLASDDASYVTGAALAVDGGMSAGL